MFVLLQKKKIRIFHTTVALPAAKDVDAYITAAATDAVLQDIIQWQTERLQHRMAFLYKQFEKVGDKWFFGKRLYIPHSESLRLAVLAKYYDLESAGHQGIRRTRSRIISQYFWPDMETDIRNYVRSCVTCQRNAQRNRPLPGLFHLLEVPTDRFKDLSIDFAKIKMSTSWPRLSYDCGRSL